MIVTSSHSSKISSMRCEMNMRECAPLSAQGKRATVKRRSTSCPASGGRLVHDEDLGRPEIALGDLDDLLVQDRACRRAARGR